MDLVDIRENVGIYAAVAAVIGLAFVVPLYVSQARDIRRLRTWMLLTPDLEAAEREAAEAARLAEPVAEAPVPASAESEAPAPPVPPAPIGRPPPGQPPPSPSTTPPRGVTPAPGTTPPRPLTPAERIALDRPATARITAERVAVREEPVGGVRRFIRRPTERSLAAIVAGVLVLAIAVVFVVLQTGDQGERGERGARPSSVVPSEVEVAVLNGTAVPDLAARVGDDVEAGDFVLGAVTNSESPLENTTVMYEPGSEDEGQAVARELGAARVVPMDDETRALADGAPVAVIAGEDRA